MPHTASPVLLLTHDPFLWDHWRAIDPAHWMPARGTSMGDLDRWRHAQRSFVLMDRHLPGRPDWNDAAWRDLCRQTSIVVASTRPDDEDAAQALSIGCSGYLHAYSSPEILNQALDTVASGGIWMGRSLVSRLLKGISQRLPANGAWMHGLTEREIQVSQLAARGQSNLEIADVLGITERTVRAHLSASFEKLQVQDRLQLTLRVHGIQ